LCPGAGQAGALLSDTGKHCCENAGVGGAYQKFQAYAIGVELDKDLYRQSLERIRKLGLEKTAHIVNGDILKQNYNSADLITVYLLPNSNEKVTAAAGAATKKGSARCRARFRIQGLDAGPGGRHPR
jgi:hypothetical protein